MIYLDNNATTPVDPEVSDAIFSSLKRDYGNPSSAHCFGYKSKEIIENARMVIADFLGCRSDEICFTSGGTESNNLSLIGTAHFRKKGHIITSVIEHPSVINTCVYLQSTGFEVTYLPVDRGGMVILNEIKSVIKKNTILISIMHSNNETGVIQPVEEVGAIAKEHGIPLHIDAAQSIGKMHFSLTDSPADIMTIASHKLYGPKGIGALYIKKGLELNHILFGAGQENGLRPGTENVPGIAGFAKACSIAKRDINLRISHTSELRDLLFNRMKSCFPDMKLNGHETKRLPNTLNVSLPGIASYELLEIIKDKVAASSGSACHSGKRSPSSILLSMGLTEDEALSSIRLSVGKDNTQDEITEAVEILVNAVNDLGKRNHR